MPDQPKTPAAPAHASDDANRQDPLRFIDDAARATGSIAHDLDHLERLATLGTISASVAHEINNLLTPVIAYAQLAKGHRDDPEMLHKALQKASSGAEAVSAIARAMLTFARPDDDASESIADVRQAVDQALSCLARHPSKDGIHLDVNIESDTEVSMQITCLQQVMMNLITNATHAIKRTRVGDGIRISASSDDGTVRVQVADNGPGMSPEIAESLFQPFRSSDPAPSGSESSGFGLGLWICRRLITQAGGQITVESAKNAGTTFIIVLPAAPNTKQIPSISRAAG